MRISQRNLPDAGDMRARDKSAGLPKAPKKKAKKKGGGRRELLGKAGKALSKDGGLNAPPDTFGAEHDEAVKIGRQIQTAARQSTRGRAQTLIKNRRV